MTGNVIVLSYKDTNSLVGRWPRVAFFRKTLPLQLTDYSIDNHNEIMCCKLTAKYNARQIIKNQNYIHVMSTQALRHKHVAKFFCRGSHRYIFRSPGSVYNNQTASRWSIILPISSSLLHACGARHSLALGHPCPRLTSSDYRYQFGSPGFKVSNISCKMLLISIFLIAPWKCKTRPFS